MLSQLGYQIVSTTGAVLVLVGFAGLQRGWMSRDDRSFNLLNLVGSLLLGWVAVTDGRWGFILLEFIWAALSVPPLLRRREPAEERR
ncbi:MAG TPA: hypothetical protein VF041_14505 [Gemmatimonadaceae bacterium]